MGTTNFEHDEGEFIFDKKITCIVCDQPFTTKILKSSKARRLGSDIDLRPRYANIDTLKYGICSCPNCGYSALHSAFTHLAHRQIENIKQEVCVHFPREDRSGWHTYTYDQAIHLHELALECADAKLAKDGEKAYLHMIIAWLLREKAEQLNDVEDEEIRTRTQAHARSQADDHYMQAFEGFQQALMNEMPPIMGMNQPTVEYILAYMAYYFGKLEISAKMVGSVLTSSSATRNVKDNALDLKDMIIAKIKENKKK